MGPKQVFANIEIPSPSSYDITEIRVAEFGSCFHPWYEWLLSKSIIHKLTKSFAQDTKTLIDKGRQSSSQGIQSPSFTIRNYKKQVEGVRGCLKNMEEARREIHAAWRWGSENGKCTYPEMPMTMAGGLVPWLMRHQLRWVVRRSRSSSCNCSNIGNPRRRNKCIVGRAIADDDSRNSKPKMEKFYLLPAKFENLTSDLLQFLKYVLQKPPSLSFVSQMLKMLNCKSVQQPRASCDLNI